MALKKYKPTSPGRRFMSVSTFEEVTKTEPEKSLTEPLKKRGGRNNQGRITTRHQGGGHKRRYRLIDFKRVKDGVPAKVAAIEYDPNRSARIALLHYLDGAKAYIIAPARLRVGAMIESGPNADIKPGNALPLENIPTGTMVHNVELKPGQGAKMARSAGASVQLVAKDEGYGVLRLPSGEMRRVTLTCRATVGQVGNTDHENQSGGKAGRSRWKGIRTAVRGSAMNPVDQAQGIRQADRSRPAPREGQALSEQIVEKGAFRGGAADEPHRGDERGQREADDPHLVALVHGLPRHGRAHDRGPRRAQARPRVRQRADGRAQARRVRSHPDVPRARGRPAGEGPEGAVVGATETQEQVVRAGAKGVRLSARKARVVLEHIRGRSVPEARTILAFTQRAAATDIDKVLRSAVANAEANHGLDGDDLVVEVAYADEGPTLKRWKPRARGRVNRIRKRTCHVTLVLVEQPEERAPRRRRAQGAETKPPAAQE